MNSIKEYPLYPNINVVNKIVKIRIHVYEYNIFENAKISVVLMDENNKPHDNKLFIIDHSNGFNEWSNDDNYIIKWVKNKIQE